ncbi:hypothetical protein [Qipengyuania flava]|uniref:hypothetical protein n=1 Tax=Qipengyuania flava TaxID=192812 RepID=UPI001C62EBFF|nr:hypothetical protein [Qipengyuania flava]QYJ07054.1 hypothetical protein KUV82_13605 [Qipengyuania flava]
MLKTAVLVSGALAALVWLLPSLVIIGFFLLFVPGFVLSLMPTVFVYLAATYLIRLVLPLPEGPLSTALAFAIALAIGWAVMQPSRAQAIREFQAAIEPDVTDGKPVALSGDVLWSKPAAFGGETGTPTCDGLCAVLLNLGDVSSVTVAEGDESATYRLIRAPERPAVPFPQDMSEIQRHIPEPGDLPSGNVSIDRMLFRGMAIEARWALRYANGDRLDVSKDAPEPDFTVRWQRGDARAATSVARYAILDGNGQALYRESRVTAHVPARVFHFAFRGGSAVDGFSSAHFAIGRDAMTEAPSLPSGADQGRLYARIDLPSPVAKLPAPPPEPGSAQRLLDLLAGALSFAPGEQRQAIVEAVRSSFIIHGPDLAEARAPLTAALEQKNGPLSGTVAENARWMFAMLRMGAREEDLPFPPGYSDHAREETLTLALKWIQRYEDALAPQE